MVDKNPLRIVTFLLYSNKFNSLHSEQVFYPIQLKNCSDISDCNFINDRVNVCQTGTCGDRLKAERVLFWFLSNSMIHKSLVWFQHSNIKGSYDTSHIL